MMIDTAPQPYMGGIPSEDRLTAFAAGLADCASLGDFNAFRETPAARSVLRGDLKQEAARMIRRRFYELCAQAPGDPARSGEQVSKDTSNHV